MYMWIKSAEVNLVDCNDEKDGLQLWLIRIKFLLASNLKSMANQIS